MSRIGPWRALAALVLAYVVLNTGLQLSRPWLSSALHISAPMQTAAFRLATSSLFLWIMLGVVALVMRARGGRLADLGFGRRGAIAGWIAAAVVFALQSTMFIAGPIGHSAWLTDWSAIRIGSALIVAISAGVCEETIFRGFIMTRPSRPACRYGSRSSLRHCCSARPTPVGVSWKVTPTCPPPSGPWSPPPSSAACSPSPMRSASAACGR